MAQEQAACSSVFGRARPAHLFSAGRVCMSGRVRTLAGGDGSALLHAGLRRCTRWLFLSAAVSILLSFCWPSLLVAPCLDKGCLP